MKFSTGKKGFPQGNLEKNDLGSKLHREHHRFETLAIIALTTFSLPVAWNENPREFSFELIVPPLGRDKVWSLTKEGEAVEEINDD